MLNDDLFEKIWYVIDVYGLDVAYDIYGVLALMVCDEMMV